jgi:hypothetical protein
MLSYKGQVKEEGLTSDIMNIVPFSFLFLEKNIGGNNFTIFSLESLNLYNTF